MTIVELWKIKTKIKERKVELGIICALSITAAVAVAIIASYDFQYSIKRNELITDILEKQDVMLKQNNVTLNKIEQTQQAGENRTNRIDTLTQYISEILAEQRFKDKQLHDIQLRIETDIQTLALQTTKITEAVNERK